MLEMRVCDWLMDNAGAPIRYRVARELLQDEKTAKKIVGQLFENSDVLLWLKNLRPENPPQHWSMEHGSADFCLENALLKIVRLGLHGGLSQVTNAIEYYIEKLETASSSRPYRNNSEFAKSGFSSMLIANFCTLAGLRNGVVLDCMLGGLEVLYNFVCKGDYDIYVGNEEKPQLKAIPVIWKNHNFIKRNLVEEYGFCFPLIYDIIALYKMYSLNNLEINRKINAVINYITTDDFHNTISDGYGILISGDRKYYAMGWDPKYPGWFNVPDYIENVNASKSLFFAENIAKYPIAHKTKWFGNLLCYLDKYRTAEGRHIFPAGWLKEQKGYAVQGHHMSFGENRRKKNWREIESTFYIQLLYQYT